MNWCVIQHAENIRVIWAMAWVLWVQSVGVWDAIAGGLIANYVICLLLHKYNHKSSI